MSVIARAWFDRIAREKVGEYVEYVKRTGVEELTATEGNRGVLVVTRPEETTAEIGVISFWRSLGDVEKFAGKDVRKAVYYDKDREYLLRMDPELSHYHVAVAEGLSLKGAEDPLEWRTPQDAKAETRHPGIRVANLWKGGSGAHAQRVEIDAGASFPELDRHDAGPEEVYVVSGVFNDGERDYPAGTFIHNPKGSSHVPQSRTGCVLFLFYPEG